MQRILWRSILSKHTFSQAYLVPKRSFFSSGSAAAAEGFINYFPQVSSELLPVILAIVLYARKDSESSDVTPADQVPYTVVERRNKGMGAIASRDIQRGEVIIAEQPLCVWPQSLSSDQADSLVSNLTAPAQRLFQDLANSQPSGSKLTSTLGIRATNGFNVQLPPIPSGSAATIQQQKYLEQRQPSHASFIFPRIARINHDCLPNADHALDWSTLQMTVYATTDIPAGQEICIEYTSGLIQKSRSERRAILKENFAFECNCSLCSRSASEVAASDERRQKITQYVDLVAEAGAAGNRRKEVVEGLKGIKRCLTEEGYKAMPEFDNEAVSSAYAVFGSMQSSLEA